MKQFFVWALLASSLVLGASSIQAEQNPSVEILVESVVTPEVGPYHSRIKSTHGALEALVQQSRPLEASQLSTIKNINKQFHIMKKNLTSNQQERSYLRHFMHPVSEIIKYISGAEKKLKEGDATASKRELKRAYQIVDMLYRKPVVQFIVAEQKVAAGVNYMSDKQYGEAVKVFDSAIDILSQIPVDKKMAYAKDLATVKSQVLALRRQAREKTIKTPLKKIQADVAASFNEAHDSVFSMWGGDMNMMKLR